MSDNPDSVPQPDQASGASVAAALTLYSPNQVTVGVLIGGLLGFVYFLHSNFRHLAMRREANLTLLAGFLMLVACWVLVYLKVSQFVIYALLIVLIMIGRFIAQRHCGTAFASQSPWKVFGMSLLCSIVFMVVLMLPFVIMNMVRGQ